MTCRALWGGAPEAQRQSGAASVATAEMYPHASVRPPLDTPAATHAPSTHPSTRPNYAPQHTLPRARPPQVFASFVREMSNQGLSESTKLLMLRTAATTHYYKASQARVLVELISFQVRRGGIR